MKNIMANKYKTLPIGTIFTYKGNKYKVCKDDYHWWICSRCAFKGINCDILKHIRGNCGLSNRTDHIGVYYKQINDETMNKDSNNNNSVIIPTFNTNNSLKDLSIDCPKGYSIDVENSNLSKGIIKFKKDNITLEDIYKDDNIDYATDLITISENKLFNKLLCIAKLIDIANYYNKGWKPDFNNDEENKYYICYSKRINMYSINPSILCTDTFVYFRNREDAKSVIDNPNFRDILDTIYKD